MNEAQTSNPNRTHMILAVLAVAVWGAYLTVGAFRSAYAPRGYVVGGMFALFLSFWLVLLAIHAGRQRRKRETEQLTASSDAVEATRTK